MHSVSRKRKLNMSISTEAELVAVGLNQFIFCGRSYLLNVKGTILTRKYCIMTTRAQFFWKLMVKGVQVREAGH